MSSSSGPFSQFIWKTAVTYAIRMYIKPSNTVWTEVAAHAIKRLH